MKIQLFRPPGPSWLAMLLDSIEDHLRRMLRASLPRDGSEPLTGPLTFAPGASVAPAEKGQVTFELTSNTALTVKAKGSDGIVRTATITLS